ncbi:Adenylosuccinate lyase-like [Homarus americanus]|uniref:Adenylosuccinate lyase-like n=1 Tax=Homarus americanus TaxID=6706 RepID=A0A8J5TWC3_HOMAM|nr:Adenylosuccinate lyase-like [Homarus americanus]
MASGGSSQDHYNSPLTTRYASQQMSYNFSDNKKFITWRRLWAMLAKAQKELGLPITDDQIKEMDANVENIDYERTAKEERDAHHVMAHARTFGAGVQQRTDHSPGASADLIVLRDGFDILLPKVARCLHRLAKFSLEQKDQPTLGFTHLQPAQLTTVGKRASLWLQELLMDERALSRTLHASYASEE